MPTYVGGDGYILSNFKGNKKSFFCSSHGVGRMYDKNETLKRFSHLSFKESLENKIKLFRYGKDKIKSQNPKAFKNIDLVLKSFKKFNLAYPICSLKPIASLKA
jgi:RNA-splicing ligase RtcB